MVRKRYSRELFIADLEQTSNFELTRRALEVFRRISKHVEYQEQGLLVLLGEFFDEGVDFQSAKIVRKKEKEEVFLSIEWTAPKHLSLNAICFEMIS